MKPEIAPSVLAADFSALGAEIKTVEACVNYLHLDIMDGHFVPNISLGTGAVAAIRKCTDLFLDVHLMITDPLGYAETFFEAGADSITVHCEVSPDIKALRKTADSYGKKLAISLNPDTPVSALEPYLPYVDMILVMSVFPGFGGQKFIPESVERIKSIRMLAPDMLIEVDGGIGMDNAANVFRAGASLLVAGSSVFGASDRPARIRAILESCEAN